MIHKIEKADEEWSKELTKEQFHVLRRKGTERAFTGTYWNYHKDGIYACAGCGTPLFISDAKYDSGTGWPSFHSPMVKERVEMIEDRSFGMVRLEAACATCGGHLGHVFDDGPRPSGQRYCINSVSLKFQNEQKKKNFGDSNQANHKENVR